VIAIAPIGAASAFVLPVTPRLDIQGRRVMFKTAKDLVATSTCKPPTPCNGMDEADKVTEFGGLCSALYANVLSDACRLNQSPLFD
jgi:hypothetical protein